VNEDRLFFRETNATERDQSQLIDTPPMEVDSRAGKAANRMAIMTLQ
jgi:hypothetical protein